VRTGPLPLIFLAFCGELEGEGGYSRHLGRPMCTEDRSVPLVRYLMMKGALHSSLHTSCFLIFPQHCAHTPLLHMPCRCSVELLAHCLRHTCMHVLAAPAPPTSPRRKQCLPSMLPLIICMLQARAPAMMFALISKSRFQMMRISKEPPCLRGECRTTLHEHYRWHFSHSVHICVHGLPAQRIWLGKC